MTAKLDEVSTKTTSDANLIAKRKKDELIERKLGYPYENFKTIELFYGQSYLKNAYIFSTSRQQYPDNKELTRTKNKCKKNDKTNEKKTKNVSVKKRYVVINRHLLKNFNNIFKSAFGINPFYSSIHLVSDRRLV